MSGQSIIIVIMYFLCCVITFTVNNGDLLHVVKVALKFSQNDAHEVLVITK